MFDSNVDSILIGAGALIASFVILIIIWSAIIRALFTLLGKSKFFFIPKTLKELFLSVAFIFLIASFMVGTGFVDKALLDNAFFKILDILAIFAVANIIVRVVLTGIDVHHKKSRDRTGIYRSIGLLKGTAGLVLYGIAILISVQILSVEVGTVVTMLALFIVVLLFVAGFDQIKSILAGFQLGDYYVDIGSMISIDGHRGFVDAIHGRSTLLKTIEGKSVVIPNSRFFSTSFELDTNQINIDVCIKTRNPKSTKEGISSVASKTVISLDDFPKEHKPKVVQLGVDNSIHLFRITFIAVPNSNMQMAVDRLCEELNAKFGEKITCIRLN
ncbi:mechanosensitive ion channel [Candidatus Micrarchaeota archaeon]|nr:mechanosensitive ion channel [Candidatus Micrarchaeota archaeon]